MVSRNRGNCVLKLRKRPSPIEKGVSLCREEPLLASTKLPLYLQTMVFTPLSIRRGGGGEAVDGLWGGCFLNKNNAFDLCTHALLGMEMVTN